MQQTYESRRLAAALLLFVGEHVPTVPMLTQRQDEDVSFRCTLAGNIVGDGERRMENGIAGFAAGEPDVAHCGHLRLHSRAQQQRATLRMTMAPHLGQETRKNISSDYETFSGMYAR